MTEPLSQEERKTVQALATVFDILTIKGLKSAKIDGSCLIVTTEDGRKFSYDSINVEVIQL